MNLNSDKSRVGRLHVIVNSDGRSRPTRSCGELARLAIEGGADTIQYRNKGGEIQQMIEEALAVRSICQENRATFIVNDRVDLCLAVDADGVHLGMEDMPIPYARKILGRGKIIGKTIRGIDGLNQAQKEFADYVGLGPIFKTQSKELTIEPLGVDKVHSVAEHAKVPVIGIGGITSETARSVVEAGAYGVAVIGAVVQADDPTEAAQLLYRSIQ